MKFYFTYGVEGQAYKGGWTIVDAPDKATAVNLFELFHPATNGCAHYCDIYTEYQFLRTKMYKEGNFGARDHERIELVYSAARKEITHEQ